MTRPILPNHTRTIRGLPRVGAAAVELADGIAARATGGRRPVTAQLSRRSLWGALQAGTPVHAPGEPLLALSFDLDYQEDTDALDGLVELVGRSGSRMSVVAIGMLVEQDPGPYERAVAAGHEIVNHTWSHPDNPVLNPQREFWDLSVEEMVEEVARAQLVFEERLDVRPAGFRTPHFKDTQRMLTALEQVPELSYVSSALGSTTPTGLPYFPARETVVGDLSHRTQSHDPRDNSRLLQVPLTPCPRHRWSPFCSYHTFRRPHVAATGQGYHPDLEDFEHLWAGLLERHRDDGFLSFYFDPKDVMRDRETADRFGEMLSASVAAGWTVTSLGEVAGRWHRALAGVDA